MQGPLKTVIRNKTDKALIYTTFPRIYVQPQSEFVLNFDPFTRWETGNALEALLVDVRLGRAQIVYMLDPLYATAGAKPSIVALSVNAEAKARGTLGKSPTPSVAKVDAPKQPERQGVPFGKLPEDADTPTPKTGAITDGQDEHPAAQINAAVIGKVAAEKPDAVVDLSADASKKAEEAVTLTPINDSEIQEKVAEAAKTAKRGRKKKEVVQL